MSKRIGDDADGIDTRPLPSIVLPSGPAPMPQPVPDPLFDEFWAAYPRKVGKGSAKRRWNVARRGGADPREIIAACERFRDDCRQNGTAQKYIPHPATWLSDERYGDDDAPLEADEGTPVAPAATAPVRRAAPLMRLNDEQLLATVIRLTADQEQPVTVATAIIRTVRQHTPSTAPPEFPSVSLERGQALAAMPYTEYLESPEWQARRKVMLRQAGYRCQVCNRDRRLHVHHRTYERRGMELPPDLVVLCDECHELFHQNGRLAGAPSGQPAA